MLECSCSSWCCLTTFQPTGLNGARQPESNLSTRYRTSGEGTEELPVQNLRQTHHTALLFHSLLLFDLRGGRRAGMGTSAGSSSTELVPSQLYNEGQDSLLANVSV